MLDIKFIRSNAELVKDAAKKKHIEVDLDRLLKVDERRRALIHEVDALRASHKESSDKIPSAEGDQRETLISKSKEEKEKLSHKEYDLRAVETEFNELMLEIPNIADPSVPEGDSDADNKEIKTWGKPKTLEELGGKDHAMIMKEQDMVDLERGVKVSGFRGYFLKNDGARLSLALWQFTLNFLVKKGFIPIFVPALVREESLVGTGHFPQAREDVYKIQDEDLYLAGTSEIPLMGYHAGEILSEEELPKKYVAFSPCFRREAGSYGKDEKGIFRVHEFFKIEQFVLCKNDHQESVKWHEELTLNAEEILQELEIPYRIVINSTGDIGRAHVKTHDIESWIPSEGKYRETHSSSYYHDFQTRRLGIKYKDADGNSKFAHSLNNTALATPRILQAILENHQEGTSISIPKVLKPYLK